ncbi:hypothetical protein BGZ46_000714 [Entomortierella lignicola]|nr:hypothetical protein BGZ46_000714 [Entomortierella lignicola]
MRFTIVAVVASLISAVMAQDAYPTAPIATTQWVAGTSPTVQWKLTNPANKTALSIDLFKGDPTHQQQVQSFGNAPAGATSFKITLPATLPADFYSIRIGDAYSHYFVIKSATGATPTGVMPTAAVANATTSAVLPAKTANATVTSASATATGTTTAAKPASGASALTVGPIAVAAALVAAVMAF